MGVLAAALVWVSWTLAPESAGAANIVVHVAEDDGAAAHELGSLVERHGNAITPPLRVEVPPADLSRLAAARARCTAPTLAVFWLDAQRADEWRLYAVPCATARPLVREIVVTAGSEQAAIESSWLIVHSSAVAIAEGHELAMREANLATLEPPAPVEPVVVPKPAPKPAPIPTVASTRVRLSIAYAGAGLGRALPWGNGIFGAIAWAPRPRLRLGAWYEFLAAGRLADPAGFTLFRHALAITAAAVLPFGRRIDRGPKRWAIELRGGPELELSRWRSAATGPKRRAIPRAGGDVTLQLGVGRHLTLDAGVGLAVPFVDVDYVTCAASGSCTGVGRRVVLDAWPVAPRARAGLSVQF